MICYKLVLFKLFISVAICSQVLRSTTVSKKFWKQATSRNNTTESPADTGILKDQVELKVYYETLCPASVDFFVTQLKPAVKRLGAHLDVHLIPYGHAKTYRSRGHYHFECQHGPRECYGNRIHACAVNILHNNTQALFFNTCLMQSISYQSNYSYFVSVMNWCGYKENVRVSDIWKCMNGSQSRVLLKKYGDATHDLRPSYVPYLMLDGSTVHQDEAAGNLFATICQLLSPKPLACLG